MSDDINGGYDIAEIERWLFNYFRTGMMEVGGFPCMFNSEPPDRDYLFWQMVRHFGQGVRPVMMYHHIWTIH